MGGGAWTSSSYSCSIRDMGFSSKNDILKSNVHQVYKMRGLVKELDPKNVIRECRDSEEHPNTLPVILALDVTGSMGSAAKACAAKLDDIMEELYGKVRDVEFLMMGIGDLSYDSAPIQASQFESDIRILDQTTKIYFEGGGGGNMWESYTAAWWFGLHHTDLDCWKRGRKGIIITMGDEPLNPYLPRRKLVDTVGNAANEGSLETPELYKEACDKFDIYHIGITDKECCFEGYKKRIHDTWKNLLGQRYLEGSSEDLPKLIGRIVMDSVGSVPEDSVVKVTAEGITW